MERTPSPHKRTFWDITREEHGTGYSKHGGTTRNTVAVEVYDDDLEEDVTVVVNYGYTAGRTQNLTEAENRTDGELSEDYSTSRSYSNRGRSSVSDTSYSYDTDGSQHSVPTIWSTHHNNSSSRSYSKGNVTDNWTKISEAWQWEEAGGGTFFGDLAQDYATNDADGGNDTDSAATYNVYGSTVDTVTCDWDQTEDDTYLDNYWKTYVCSTSTFNTVTLNSNGVEVPTIDWKFEEDVEVVMPATITNTKAAADHEYEYTLIGGIDTNILVESFNPFLPVQYDTSFDLNYGCFDIAREEVRWWVKESIKPLANRSDSISGVLSDIFDSTATDKTFSPDVNYSQQKRTTHRVFCLSHDTSERVETEDGEDVTYTDTDYSLDGVSWDLTAAPLHTTVEFLGLPFESKEEDGESWNQITVQSKDWDSVMSSCSFYSTTELAGNLEWAQTYATHHWSSVETVTSVAKSSSRASILCSSYRSYIGTGDTEWSFIGFYSTTSSSFFISSTTFARTTWDDYYTAYHICRVTTSSYDVDGGGFNNTATATRSTTSAYTATGTTAVTVTVGETKIENAIYPLGRSVQEWGDFHGGGPEIEGGASGWVQAHPNGWFGFGGGFESTDKVYSALNTAVVSGPLHSSFSTIAADGIPAVVAVSHDLVAEGQKVKAWATRDHECLDGDARVFYGWFETSFVSTHSTRALLLVTFTDTQATNATRGSSLSWEAKIGLSAADSIDGTWFADLGIAGMVTDGPPVNKLKREVGRAYAANFSESPATVSLDVGAWTQTLWTGRGSADSVSSAFTLTEYDTFSFANHQGAVWSSEQIFVVTGDYVDFMLGSFTNDHYL